MVNKREKTRSLVYQMKEDIFRHEAALAELELGESPSAEHVPTRTKVVPLPQFCHHSTGTVYDRPEDILRMAQLFEERGQILDRKNSAQMSSPLRSRSRLAATADSSLVSPRRARQTMRPSQSDVDGIGALPAAGRSPIQQLFRDKMEAPEYGSWIASSLEVKTDSTSDGPTETNHETPAAGSELLNSLTVTPSSNGLVKTLCTVDGRKDSNSEPVGRDIREDNKSFEELLSTGISERKETALAFVTDVEPDSDDVGVTERDSKAVNDADKVSAAEENDRVHVGGEDSESLETPKVAAVKSSSRSAQRKRLAAEKKDSSKESRSLKTDTTPQTQSRRRQSKEPPDTEKLNCVIQSERSRLPRSASRSRSSEQLVIGNDSLTTQSADSQSKEPLDTAKMTPDSNTRLSERSRLPRSATRSRSSQQLIDDKDSLTTQPADTQRKASLSSSQRPGIKKVIDNDKVCTQDAKSDGNLQQEVSGDKQHKVTAGGGQKVPLQESSALNHISESVMKDIGNSSSEGHESTGLACQKSSDLETTSVPYFHSDNFRLVDTSKMSSVTPESRTSVTEKSCLPRSANRSRSSRQLGEGSDSLTTQPDDPQRKPSLSSRRCPGNKKAIDSNKVCTQDAESDSVLQREISGDKQHEVTAGGGQKVPLQESSALNHISESVMKDIGKISSEGHESTGLTCRKSSDLETSSVPYFHTDNFRMVELDSPKKNSDQNQTTCLQSVESEVDRSEESEDANTVSDDRVVDSDTASSLTGVVSSKQCESGNLLHGDHDNFMPKTSALKSENVKKRPLPVSRSRSKSHPGLSGTDSQSELHDKTEKGSKTKEDDAGKSGARRRRRVSSVDDAKSVSEPKRMKFTSTPFYHSNPSNISHPITTLTEFLNRMRQVTTQAGTGSNPSGVVCESKVSNLTDRSASAGKNSLMVDCREDVTSSVASAATVGRVIEQINCSLPADKVCLRDSVSQTSSQGSSDITGVDNVSMRSKLAASHSHKSPRNLPAEPMKSRVNTRTDIQTDGARSSVRVREDHNSRRNDVGGSRLGSTSTANSRNRAAHLMAGCRHRTVGVKKPTLTIDLTASDQEVEASDHSKQTISVHQVDSIAFSCNHPSPPKHGPFFRTSTSIPECKPVNTLAESLNRVLYLNSQANMNLNSDSESTDDKEVIKSESEPCPPAVVKEEDGSLPNERPQVTKQDAVSNGSALGSQESEVVTSQNVVVNSENSRRESIRAELLRKFSPNQLIISDSIKRRVQDGLQLLSSIRSAPTICSHARQKLAEYLNQSRRDTAHERQPLRPLDDKRDQSPTTLTRRRMPARPRRRVYSEWEYVSGEELTSPVSDADPESDSDYSVDFEDLAVSNSCVRSSQCPVRTSDRRLSTVHH